MTIKYEKQSDYPVDTLHPQLATYQPELDFAAGGDQIADTLFDEAFVELAHLNALRAAKPVVARVVDLPPYNSEGTYL